MAENFKNLTIGINIKKEKGPIYLSDSSRKSSTLVIGTKNSGKSQYVVPVLVKQDLEQKDAGMTIIVSQKDAAYNIYAMAKKKKRKVFLLKPEVNFEIINDFLWREDWDYNYINENLIDYKKAIREKAIIIIDMEYSRYRVNATRAVSMLLLQLQADMSETSTTLTRRHFVYIDDAYRYLPFIEQLLYEGDTYNMSTTLFIQGRNQLTTYDKDYSSIVDNNVRNTILMPGLNYEDTKYYAEKLCPPNKSLKDYTYELQMRKYGEFVYELVGSDYEKYIGNGILLGMPESERDLIYRNGRKARKKLRVEFKNEVIARRLQLQEEISSANKLPKIEMGDEEREDIQPTILEETLLMKEESPIKTEEKSETKTEVKKEEKKEKPVSEDGGTDGDALMSLLSEGEADDFGMDSFDDFPEDDISDYDFSLEEKEDTEQEDVEEELGDNEESDSGNAETEEDKDSIEEESDDKEVEEDKEEDDDDIDIYEDFDIVLKDLPEIPKERVSFRPIRLNEQLHIQSAQEQFNRELRDKFD